jgi:UDP-N-acetylglucosamine 1-carboxyvinyltransferase
MLVAALIAKGATEIEEIHHIERGYENVLHKLRALGAEIKRIAEPDSAMELDMVVE